MKKLNITTIPDTCFVPLPVTKPLTGETLSYSNPQISLPVLKLYVVERVQCVLFGTWLPSVHRMRVGLICSIVQSNASFPLIHSIPSYDHSTIYVSILLLMDIQVISTVGLL